MLFEFECKHGKPLESAHAEEYPQHECTKCNGPVKEEIFLDELKKLKGYMPSLKP